MTTKQWMLESKVGPIYLLADETSLRGVYWRPSSVEKLLDLEDGSKQAEILKETVRQLNEYFQGKRKAFDLPLNLSGTKFQMQVWNELAQIPYGKTVAYKDIAMKIKNDKAVRAVGTANGRNPVSIVVPCHRVIASDGTMGGYGGGLHIKEALLSIEGL